MHPRFPLTSNSLTKNHERLVGGEVPDYRGRRSRQVLSGHSACSPTWNIHNTERRRETSTRLTPPLNFQFNFPLRTDVFQPPTPSTPASTHGSPTPIPFRPQDGFLQPTQVPGACLAAAAITYPRPCAPCTKAPPSLPHLQAFSSMNSLSRLQIKVE